MMTVKPMKELWQSVVDEHIMSFLMVAFFGLLIHLATSLHNYDIDGVYVPNSLTNELKNFPPLMIKLPHTVCIMMVVKPMKELWQSVVDQHIM